ncbi:MAG: prepilin-type N-terminal cleavage/methylation domain-containing protein [Candidatus Riflebacteria bacterium]|nr:prepilin-type N-terminal cleavage/methylation domain-containing protein [Candidatus Riflebacteria bacterium]
MTKKGFTIIELLIVIAIISILVGVAVPYYNDYIYDARLSTLRQNLASYRSVLNQFRGDNSRGPFLVPVSSGTFSLHVDPRSGNASGSELVSGSVQNISNVFVRRSNLKYLLSMPVFLNPKDGSPIPSSDWTLGSPSAYYYDVDTNGTFDIGTEFAFADYDNNASFTASIDAQILNSVALSGSGAGDPLDYTSFVVTADGVDY